MFSLKSNIPSYEWNVLFLELCSWPFKQLNHVMWYNLSTVIHIINIITFFFAYWPLMFQVSSDIVLFWWKRTAHACQPLHTDHLPQACSPSNQEIPSFVLFMKLLDIRDSCTVFVGAADQGLALRAWPNHSGRRHSNAVLGPLLQPLQQHLLFGGRDCRLLHGFLIITATLWRAHHLVQHPIPRQDTVLTLQRRGAPTYQQGGGAGAAALNVLRGGWGLWWGWKDRKEGGRGRGRGEGRGEKQKNKKMGEIKKMIKG